MHNFLNILQKRDIRKRTLLNSFFLKNGPLLCIIFLVYFKVINLLFLLSDLSLNFHHDLLEVVPWIEYVSIAHVLETIPGKQYGEKEVFSSRQLPYHEWMHVAMGMGFGTNLTLLLTLPCFN